jgi:phage host-nuclease inhibitor protein Gam
MKRPRHKSTALPIAAPQDRDQCAAQIARLGEIERDRQRLLAEMNDQLALITEKYQPLLEEYARDITGRTAAIQVWCEANRAELTRGGRVKHCDLVTGEIAWRVRPPSVTVRGVDAVLEALHERGLGRFIRTKEEVNRDAILNEPAAVTGVPGIKIVTGIEDFIVTPFEVQP